MRLKSILSWKTLLIAYTLVIVIYIYAPILFLIVFSFKVGSGISFPITGWTDFWYVGEVKFAQWVGVFNDTMIWKYFANSLIVAAVTTVIVTLLVLSLSLRLRREFKGKNLIFYMVMAGIIIPGMTYGMGALYFYRSLNIDISLWTGIPVQVVWTLPWGLILTLARFDPALVAYEEAARTLGASGLRVFREITFPLIFPQVLATILFAFTLSWGELIRSSFVSSGRGSTLPVYIFALLSSQPATPRFYALGTITVLVSFALMIGVGLFLSRGGRRLF